MSNDQLLKPEFESVLDQMMKDGELVTDSNGRYSLTSYGHSRRRKSHLDGATGCLGKKTSCTYAGLVYLTDLQPSELNIVLIEALRDGKIEHGVRGETESLIFYVPSKERNRKMNLLCHPDESTTVRLHADDERELLRSMTAFKIQS